MAAMKKLPDAEFEVMNALWGFAPPVSSGMLMETLNSGQAKAWKLQTLHTLLGRLEKRGFLKSEKTGKERLFTPLVGREDYLQFETQSFVRQYHGGKLLSLVSTLYQGRRLDDGELAELIKWANEKGEGR